MREDNQSLSHTTWNCKYHIVFAPKYRRQIIYGRYKASIGRIIRDLCERKGVIIHEANACSDHIHMLISIPPKLSVSSFMGYLKGKSSLMIFDKHANLNQKVEDTILLNIFQYYPMKYNEEKSVFQQLPLLAE
ncbi:IS200 family transposase [Streptococcus pneumoniae]|nr:IS200 family transposase [Streptococcus pneumoniae]